MTSVSTHVLDLARGNPVDDVGVVLERARDEGWIAVDRSHTDTDGRAQLVQDGEVERGVYRLVFAVQSHLQNQDGGFSFGDVTVSFEILDPTRPFHLPLLLAPFGFFAYLGT